MQEAVLQNKKLRHILILTQLVYCAAGINTYLKRLALIVEFKTDRRRPCIGIIAS